MEDTKTLQERLAGMLAVTSYMVGFADQLKDQRPDEVTEEQWKDRMTGFAAAVEVMNTFAKSFRDANEIPV